MTVENNRIIAEFMGTVMKTTVKDNDVVKGYKMIDCSIYTKEPFIYINPGFRHVPPSCDLEEMRIICENEVWDQLGKKAQYHISWDWLMPVVEKIQSIDITPAPRYDSYRIEIVVQGYVKIQGTGMPRIFKNVSIEGGLINAVYAAVLQFIIWYNQNKKV